MMQIGLFYGSTDGHTTRVARALKEELEQTTDANGAAAITVDLLDVAEYYLDEMLQYDFLILGIPTWNVGQMQADWEEAFDELDELDLTDIRVAVFGLGDQENYAKTFADAIFFLADKVREQGAQLVGAWSTEGYRFEQSWAAQDGEFLGLVLDEHNQAHLTPMRIALWAAQLKVEFSVPR
jgi:flavodoxin I